MKRPTGDAETEGIWPSADYQRGVSRLREHVGRPVFLVEVARASVPGAVALSDQAVDLLAVVDFPRPDPLLHLLPHLLILGDGRGINLGRVLRVSIHRPFSPSADQLLYLDQPSFHRLLSRPQRFNRRLLALRSRWLLAGRLSARPLLTTFSRKVSGLPAQEDGDFHNNESESDCD